MSVLHIVILAVVQGITEFLPISSQEHLLLTDAVLLRLGIIEAQPPPEIQLTMWVAVHVGSLGAVVLYFWRGLLDLLGGLGRFLMGRPDPGARLAGHVFVATLPVLAAGYAIDTYGPWGLRGAAVTASATLGFGLVLYVADKLGMTVRRVEHVSLGDAIIVGCAQALAVIPGTSRSGITMSAGRLLGLERGEAARFSMLLAVPAILAAGLWRGWQVYRSGDAQLTTDALLGAGFAFVAAWFAIYGLMAWLRHATFTPFVVYRVVLGAVLLVAIFYGWIE